MEVQLQTPKQPVEMISGYITEEETTLIVYCHDLYFERVTISDAAGNTVFRGEGAKFGRSWSFRRKLFDASNGRLLFDIRHRSLDIKNRWVIEGSDGSHICSLEHVSQITNNHSAIDATVLTETGEEVRVAMRPNDHSALTTTVNVGNAAVATIRKVEDNIKQHRGGRDKTVWEVRVASGVDLSFVMVMALCRAEMGHVWQQ